jgi:hypothetical protein
MPAVELTPSQQQDLWERGYTLLPGAVPRDRVHAALRAINASLGERGMHPDELVRFRSQSYCPELQGSQAIVDLYQASAARAVAEAAIGPGMVRPVRGGQIALRFPAAGDPPREPVPHIDGMHSPTNGVPPGTIANFTALVGVFLSEVPGPYCGNFTVWPGSHRLYEQYFRARGPQSLLEGMPPVDLPPPVQITAHPGDAVLCHYQLGHGIAGNASPFIRYGIFFRLSHVRHDEVHWECMTDIWLEWAGMRDFVAAAGGR